MRKLTKLSIAAAIIGIGSLLISYIGGPSRAVTIDNTPDCDTVAIFYCGAMSESQFHQKWDNDKRHKDHQTVFNAFGIKKDDVRGMVDGVVWRDGRVTLGSNQNGKVVATNATTAGRWNNPASDMTRIAGTDRAYKMPTRHFVDHGQTAMIKLDKNGKFLFAVIKSCGNPVVAKPVEPPKPKPSPTAKCEALNQPVITNRTNVALTARASTQNGATIRGYVFTITNASGNIVATRTVNQTSSQATTSLTVNNPGTYTAKVVVQTSVGNKEAASCEKKFTIKPAPAAKCEALSQPVVTNRTNVALAARASAQNGATISKYTFTIRNSSGQVVQTREVNTTATTASTNMSVSTPGTYTAKVVVQTSVGAKEAADCEKKFTIQPEPKPGIEVDKKVEGKDHKEVGLDTKYNYQIRVTNTGETNLRNVVVTDQQPEGVTFLDASHGQIVNQIWTYTIPELKSGEHMDFTITAKVPTYLAGTIINTVCVDAPSIPGKPDDCDDATVEVPEPKKIIVCDLDTKEYPVTIKEKEFDSSKHSMDPEDCKAKPITPPVTPPELPQTGAVSDILNGLGLGALVTSSLAYIASRRSNLI